MLERVIEYTVIRKNKTSSWRHVQEIEQGSGSVVDDKWYIVLGQRDDRKLIPVEFMTAHISDRRYETIKVQMQGLAEKYQGKKLTQQEIRHFEQQIYDFCAKEDYKGDDGRIVCIVTDVEKGALQLKDYKVRSKESDV